MSIPKILEPEVIIDPYKNYRNSLIKRIIFSPSFINDNSNFSKNRLANIYPSSFLQDKYECMLTSKESLTGFSAIIYNITTLKSMANIIEQSMDSKDNIINVVENNIS